MARVRESPAFRDALLREGIDALLAGELDVGKSILRDYINATIGFEQLAEETGTSSKSLMRMFSRSGNPNARNLFSVIRSLQHASRVSLRVRRGTRTSEARGQR